MRRKRFIPKIFLILFLWTAWFCLIFKFPPETPSIIGVFFLLFFGALSSTLSLILSNQKYAFLLAGTSTVFLVLRILKMANILNIILLLALTLTLGLFFHQRETGRRERNLPQG